MQNNQISAVIAEADKTAIAEAITTIKTKLANVLIFSLPTEERRGSFKLGDKNLAFIQKSLQYAEQYPELVPPFLNTAEARKDFNLAVELQQLLNQLYALITSIEDATTVAGSEAYDAALIFYNAVKTAVRSNVPGSQSIADDLGQQFPGRSKAAAKANTTKTQ
jgi:hypothetical protein